MDSYMTSSLQLYGHLCDLIGSEKSVNLRRVYFRVLDDVMNTKEQQNKTFVSSGSMAEGLGFPGSDYDVMVILDDLDVCQESCALIEENILVCDVENAMPGFAYIKLHQNYTDPEIILEDCFVHAENGIVLSSYKFKQELLQFFPNLFPDTIQLSTFGTHGPCISDKIAGTLDFALCLPSQQWPYAANKWLSRPHAGWPSVALKSAVAENGVLFVPTGTYNQQIDRDPNVWRISFSLGEKILVHSFNHTQLLCYIILKFILKEVINKNSQLQDLLCSYFMKTILFWVMEEEQPFQWTPENLILCFKCCFKRLIYFVNCGYCPNYFIPENNMFSSKIRGRKQQILLEFLNGLYHEDFFGILRCKSLTDFQGLHPESMKSHDFIVDNAIFPLLGSSVAISGGKCRKDIIPSIMKKLRITGLSKISKEIYALFFIKCIEAYAVQIDYKCGSSNKNLYERYQYLRCLFLIASNFDALSGWVTLAMFFYAHEQYQEAIFVLKYALSECSHDKQHICVNGFGWKNNETVYQDIGISFLRRLKMSCISHVVLCPTKDTVFWKSDFGIGFVTDISDTVMTQFFFQESQEEFYDTPLSLGKFLGADMFSIVKAPSLPLAQFLIFMCFYRLKKIDKQERQIVSLAFAVKDDILEKNTLWSDSFTLLMKAIDLSRKTISIPNTVKQINEEVGHWVMEKCISENIFATCHEGLKLLLLKFKSF